MKRNSSQTIHIIGIFIAFLMLMAIYFAVAIIIRKDFPQYSVWKLFLIYASGNNVDSEFSVENIYILLLLGRIFEVILLAVVSSFVYSSLLNRGVKLVFPEKIVIRRRSSEGSDGKLCIGILVGNPHMYTLFDVECWVSCSYIKEKGTVNKRNSEVVLVQSVKKLKNYYRFSFEFTKLHKKFWKDFLERDIDCMNEDYITIIISGRANTLGGIFTIEKKYLLSDIGIDLRNPEDDFKIVVQNRFTGEKKVKIDWAKFPKFIEAGETERAEVINEIKRYVNS